MYDVGDNWQHRIKIEKTLVPDLRHPRFSVCFLSFGLLLDAPG